MARILLIVTLLTFSFMIKAFAINGEEKQMNLKKAACIAAAEEAVTKIAAALGLGEKVVFSGGAEIVREYVNEANENIYDISNGAWVVKGDDDGLGSNIGGSMSMILTPKGCKVLSLKISSEAGVYWPSK